MEDSPDQSNKVSSSVKVPVIEEHVRYTTQQRQTGKVRITKQVHEDIIDVDESVTHEKVEIERVPVNQYVDEAPPSVRYENDVMIVSVLEEVLVKRLLLVEELHVRKIQETETDKKELTLRKETVEIHRDQEEN